MDTAVKVPFGTINIFNYTFGKEEFAIMKAKYQVEMVDSRGSPHSYIFTGPRRGLASMLNEYWPSVIAEFVTEENTAIKDHPFLCTLQKQSQQPIIVTADLGDFSPENGYEVSMPVKLGALKKGEIAQILINGQEIEIRRLY